MSQFLESVVEETALKWLGGIGWGVAYATDIATDSPAAERVHYSEAVLSQCLCQVLARLNSELPADTSDEDYRASLWPVMTVKIDSVCQPWAIASRDWTSWHPTA